LVATAQPGLSKIGFAQNLRQYLHFVLREPSYN